MGPQRDVKTSLTLLEATKKRDHKRSQDGIPQGTLSGAIKRRKSGVVIGGTSPVVQKDHRKDFQSFQKDREENAAVRKELVTKGLFGRLRYQYESHEVALEVYD